MHYCSIVHTGHKYAKIWSLYSLQRQLVNSWTDTVPLATVICLHPYVQHKWRDLRLSYVNVNILPEQQLVWQVVSKMNKVNNCFGSECNKRVDSTQHWSLHGNWPTCERMLRMLLWRKPPQCVELQHQSLLHPTYRGRWDKPPRTLKYPNHRSPS